MKIKVKNYLFFTLVLTTFFFSVPVSTVDYYGQNDRIITDDLNKTETDAPLSQDLSSDNVFSGIGAPWNLTYWANRTDPGLTVNFESNSSDIAEIPLGVGWESIKLSANVRDLYDERNWNNGSFTYGDDDDDYSASQNDSADIENLFQNWTFSLEEGGIYTNDMSGNYLDNASLVPDSEGHDCLELRMDGEQDGGSRIYEENDRCWWSSSITVPRGRVIDSELYFEVRDYHLMNDNSFELIIYLNDVKIFSKGIGNLKQYSQNSWSNFSIPQGFWINQTNIYSSPINDSEIEIKVALEYISESASYSGFENQEYQQLFIDNIKLVVKAESKPTQIGLQMNGIDVNDVNWSLGNIVQYYNWNSTPVQANFSSNDESDFNIELLTDLNLHAIQNHPDTNYETNIGSLGTSFSVDNNSIVNWQCYGYVSVPSGYKETEIKLNYPEDVELTGVYEPQNPSINIVEDCDYSTSGTLTIPVENISSMPDGFWKFEGLSPNYCEQLTVLKNTSNLPAELEWEEEDTFISGDFVNITAKIKNSTEILEHILETVLKLQIRFPNGSIWTAQSQIKSPNYDGVTYFDYFQIPDFVAEDYIVGDYEAIVTWNNSHSIYDLNETGIIVKNFRVIHRSVITPEHIYYENVIENSVVNLRISFNDLINNMGIENAEVYLKNFTSGVQNFIETGGGYYFIVFNVSEASSGDNNITIYANSSYYLSSEVNITIFVVRESVLTIDGYSSIEIYWNQNFTVRLNYTEKFSGLGIISAPSSDWIGNTYFTSEKPGEYNITFNSSAYEVNKIHLLSIQMVAPGFQTQSILINVKINEQPVELSVSINSTEISENSIFEIIYEEEIQISATIYATFEDRYLSQGDVIWFSDSISRNLTEYDDFCYNITINCDPSKLSLGLNYVDIRFQKDNYSTTLFSFQLSVQQINIDVIPSNFEDSIEAYMGDKIEIIIDLKESGTNNSVENATVSYSWAYGVGNLVEIGGGIYKLELDVPLKIEGSHKISLFISKEDILYKTRQFSFILVASEKLQSNSMIWITIFALLSIIGILGLLSLRSYVFLPKKRKQGAELLARTQPFKDIDNIQAVVVIRNGIPIFVKSYSILADSKKEIFSGLIEAILTISEQFFGKEPDIVTMKKKDNRFKNLLELDFKYFQCVICNKEEVRFVFILKERASERLKQEINRFATKIYSYYSKELNGWDGNLLIFEELLTPIVVQHFKLYYKDSYKLPEDSADQLRIKKSGDLSKIELKISKRIRALQKLHKEFKLNDIVEMINDENKDSVIDGIESLIKRNIITPVFHI